MYINALQKNIIKKLLTNRAKKKKVETTPIEYNFDSQPNEIDILSYMHTSIDEEVDPHALLEKENQEKEINKITSDLIIFICREDIENIVATITKNPDVLKSTDPFYGFTPLHWAVRCNSTAISKILIEHKSNINATSNILQTPLHLAVMQKNYEVAKLLLSNPLIDLAAMDYTCRCPSDYVTDAHDEYFKEIFKISSHDGSAKIDGGNLKDPKTIDNSEAIKFNESDYSGSKKKLMRSNSTTWTISPKNDFPPKSDKKPDKSSVKSAQVISTNTS